MWAENVYLKPGTEFFRRFENQIWKILELTNAIQKKKKRTFFKSVFWRYKNTENCANNANYSNTFF